MSSTGWSARSARRDDVAANPSSTVCPHKGATLRGDSVPTLACDWTAWGGTCRIGTGTSGTLQGSATWKAGRTPRPRETLRRLSLRRVHVRPGRLLRRDRRRNRRPGHSGLASVAWSPSSAMSVVAAVTEGSPLDLGRTPAGTPSCDTRTGTEPACERAEPLAAESVVNPHGVALDARPSLTVKATIN